MRNLKRVLALAMAMVMILGMMVIGSSAASYSDADAIDAKYAEAVEVLSGLGVFKGTGAGFAPKQILTRAEAAALIYRVITGDVKDEQTQNYDYASLKDIQAGQWYTGYVTYANNGGYIKGDDLGNFNPGAQVTGVQVMAIMLRAAGYGLNGEYEGAAWMDNILTDAKELGITGSISTATLNAPATRELVAQLIFNAISSVDMVNYNMLNGYKSTGETLGEKVFALVEIEGVVTANEYANLDGAKVLKAGKTVIGGTQYSGSTEITDIGESRVGWAAGKAKTILYLADSGKNTVWENAGAETDISTAKKFEKVTGLEDAAEDYANFDNYEENYYETDILISYSLTGKAADAVQIKAGKSMTEEQYNDIWSIFYDDEYAEGWVIVGTKVNADDEKNAANDISDEISFKKFVAEYLADPAEVGTIDVDKVGNGEWLKVVDNDGDGKADYVFAMWFEMTDVISVKTTKGVTTWKLTGLTVNDEDVTVVADDVAAKDVVIWTYVDGVVYIKAAEKVTETIDKKGIDSKAKTITCGDNVYGQSAIYWEEIGMDENIMAADTQVAYDMYLDFFGYVRMYEESAWGKGFVLLTDGYFETDRRADDIYKAEIWNTEDEAYEDVTVVDAKKNPADIFINDDDATGEKDWDRLKEADQVYGLDTEFATNVAAYTVNDDGEYTLVKINGLNTVSNKVPYYVEELALDAKSDLDDKTLTEVDGGTVQATTDTQYYLVVTTSKGKQVITSWTGYKNAPETAALGDMRAAYAVVHEGKAYDIADVIVFETDEYDASDLYLVYDYNNYNAITIGVEEEEYVSGLYVDMDTDRAAEIAAKLTAGVADYYVITASGDAKAIDTEKLGEYAEENIYAGTVVNDDDVDTRDYIKIAREGAKTLYFYEGDAPIFAITKTGPKISVAELEYQDVLYLDKLVVVTDAKGNIEYLVDVSVEDDATGSLWNDIWVDAQDAVLNDKIELTVTYGGIEVTAGVTKNLTYAQAKGAKWDVEAKNGTVVLKETENGYTMTVIAQSEDGKTTDSFTYTVSVAAPATDANFKWTAAYSEDVAAGIVTADWSKDELTVAANWLEAKDMSLADFVAAYAEPTDVNATDAIVENANGSVTYTVTAEDGTTAKDYTFVVGA